MKTPATTILLIMFSIVLFSQKNEIDQIRKLYYQINEDNFQYHDITLNTILPAVGKQTKKIRLYYSASQINPEIDPYNMAFHLYKAEVKYNISASSFLTYEYLFNNKGKLIFYFDKEEGEYGNHEKRYYYNNEKLIKCKIYIDNFDGNISNYSKTQQFNNTDTNDAIQAIEKAKKYNSLFKQLIIIFETDF